MPKIAIDYSKTIIYQIRCLDKNITDIYIGHTTDFTQRQSKHKSKCNTGVDMIIYNTIRNNGGWNNWIMEILETCNCKDVNEAKIKEREWYEKLQPKLNNCVPIQTKEEREKSHLKRYQKNKDYYKQYRDEHKNESAEYRAEYYEQNREKLLEQKKEYSQRQDVKEKRKAYLEANKEKIKQQKKEWYEKQKLLKQQQEI